MSRILLSDPTLRDGNHAIAHKLNVDQIGAYCRAVDAAGVPIVEVGHGNGVGASSLQVGRAAETDAAMLRAARDNLKNAKLAIYAIPGFATVDRDLRSAVDMGVDVIRVGSHCTEADTMQKHIAFGRASGRMTVANLMMCHMATVETLLEQARKTQDYGAEAVVLMDSAGALIPDDVTKIIDRLRGGLEIAVGFHAHNNLGFGIANSVAALRAGATILDASTRGFGAGAGNAQLEVLAAVLERLGVATGIDMRKMRPAIDLVDSFGPAPSISYISLASGLAGVFSGFARHVRRLSEEYGVSEWDVFMELGRRRVVAGQEDQILDVVLTLSRERRPEGAHEHVG